MDGARTLLHALPKRLGGQARTLHTDPRDENHAGAQYGTLTSVSVAQEYVSDDTASGEPELFSANNLLATQFGLGAVCAEGSYRGTLPKHPDYPGPGVTEKPLRKSVWFSCRMMYDIGEKEQAGQAVGWTSKKTAWLVIAPDDGTARSLVTALQNQLEQ